MNRNISFEYPKKSLLKSNYPKITCQNFPVQKNPEIIPLTWNPQLELTDA